MKTKAFITAVTLSASALLGSIAAATPASAVAPTADPVQIMASSRCLVGYSGNCTTAAVRANANGHFVDIVINNRLRPSPCTWQLRDAVNWLAVRSGVTGTGGRTAQRVPGLYSLYQLELRGCSISATGVIDND